MKQAKKLTRDNKKIVAAVGLNPTEWMMMMEDKMYLHIVKKDTSERSIISKDSKKIIS